MKKFVKVSASIVFGSEDNVMDIVDVSGGGMGMGGLGKPLKVAEKSAEEFLPVQPADKQQQQKKKITTDEQPLPEKIVLYFDDGDDHPSSADVSLEEKKKEMEEKEEKEADASPEPKEVTPLAVQSKITSNAAAASAAKNDNPEYKVVLEEEEKKKNEEKKIVKVEEVEVVNSSESNVVVVDDGGNSSLGGNQQQQQTVKKVRGLIANFVTLEVEQPPPQQSYQEEVTGDSEVNRALFEGGGEEDNLEDLEDKDDDGDDLQTLSRVDREKLGFQNFDGKNIGLYKNIGYINRNRAQFVQPTQALLQL